eukprot:TRINITY_DN14819_c0_g1_i1.p1 TRINITY_DN14819_c0_g1~~TRINITY_DN14819_c0_g1_i1.p1  ORF type:complete len:139 (+),score=11.14 TRINITY_DN14819_c0_g1_i1:209-625(+)
MQQYLRRSPSSSKSRPSNSPYNHNQKDMTIEPPKVTLPVRPKKITTTTKGQQHRKPLTTTKGQPHPRELQQQKDNNNNNKTTTELELLYGAPRQGRNLSNRRRSKKRTKTSCDLNFDACLVKSDVIQMYHIYYHNDFL